MYYARPVGWPIPRPSLRDRCARSIIRRTLVFAEIRHRASANSSAIYANPCMFSYQSIAQAVGLPCHMRAGHPACALLAKTELECCAGGTLIRASPRSVSLLRTVRAPAMEIGLEISRLQLRMFGTRRQDLERIE
jgi:hypothetical protein